jgi:hypothetical protein
MKIFGCDERSDGVPESHTGLEVTNKSFTPTVNLYSLAPLSDTYPKFDFSNAWILIGGG